MAAPLSAYTPECLTISTSADALNFCFQKLLMVLAALFVPMLRILNLYNVLIFLNHFHFIFQQLHEAVSVRGYRTSPEVVWLVA